MPTSESTHENPRRHRRFWRLFRREKPSSVDLTYSYQYMMRFPRLPITVPPLVPTLMSYRWNDEDDCEPLPKKLSRANHHQQQHARRRLPKRYSDIVGPSLTKAFASRKDPTIREKQTATPSSQHNHHRESLKANNNDCLYITNSHHKKSRELLPSSPRIENKEPAVVTRRYSSKNKRLSTTNAVDLLAHRMQAAMSTELMHSLDRNFVFGDKKQAANYFHMNRSHSFNISTPPSNDWWRKSLQQQQQQQQHHYYHIIPRVKHYVDDEQKSIGTDHSFDEPTPDYDEEIIIRRINKDTDDDIVEEPIADYDDPKPDYEVEEKSITPTTLYDLGVSSSFVIPQTSITLSRDSYTQEQTSIPPTPPPLIISAIEQKKTTFRCRTIADKITANHKLILKDEEETITTITEDKQSVPQYQEQYSKKSRYIPSVAPKPHYLHLSKDLLEKNTLRKVPQPISRSYSIYGSISQLNDHHTESTTLHEKTSIIDEQSFDGLSSSATTSIIIENDSEHKSSSKIYNDYKRRASLISVPTSNTLNDNHSHSSIIHPMHTHIGLRSSTSSPSANDKLSELNLSNKQMNVCVINQLNEHLSSRFRKQHQDICLTTDIEKITNDHESYDQPPADITNNTQANVYDVPNDIEITKTFDISSSSIPPPPPPLPVGGFRPHVSQVIRSSSSQRTSIMTLPREPNGSELGFNTGTSTTSSKLSDTRILRELRTNPLFAKAKQHLEIECGSNGRRSSRRLHGSNTNESVSYLRLNTCSKGDLLPNINTNQNESIKNLSTKVENFLMHSNELNSVIDNTTKRTKSINSSPNETNSNKSRTFTKALLQTQFRQSELEVIFQKRAQRSEQNLT